MKNNTRLGSFFISFSRIDDVSWLINCHRIQIHLRSSFLGSSDHGRSDNEVTKIVFQSTCHVAMESCNNNYNCRMLLAPILHHCDISRCNRNSCMEALQAFYRKPSLPWNIEIAFCLCKYVFFPPKTKKNCSNYLNAPRRAYTRCTHIIFSKILGFNLNLC